MIEHVPDLIGWLEDVHDCLNDGGILALAIPDKRFTFDRLRRCTSLSDLVQAHFSGAVAPSYGMVFDHVAYVRAVDVAAAWGGGPAVAEDPPEGHGLASALNHCRAMRRSGRYFDVHCHVLTPGSFAHLLDNLAHLGMLRLHIADYVETPRGAHEFFVVLRRGDGATDAAGPIAVRTDLPVAAGDHAEQALRQQSREDREETIRALEEVSALRGEADVLRRTVAGLEDALGSRDRELAGTKAAREALAAELSALRSSTSWRLTAPLRRVRRWLRRTG